MNFEIDLNLRRETLLDFESNALTTQPSQLREQKNICTYEQLTRCTSESGSSHVDVNFTTIYIQYKDVPLKGI